ncbi:XRE family transcriptional regulator [Rothia nasimurium]|uniref:XRE family transcriptional regulator n=1 Tax=Rothia nasimurium TaxID=85336 RepID=A0A4Y9F5X0_9MICC|nr:helix-turn-helix transcriptional regulator [Rothia nasimurium]MBF0807743.1 helix-turn-helix domain-containing protein [Rothia nasimurium]TFU23260.1 XRE family transcriptional regulator [Rothia nasimurium]
MTLDELLKIHPVDPEYIEQELQEMRAETRLYQLRELRKDTGITQAQLAERLGVSQHRVSQIENGNLPNVKIETLQKYLEALGTSITISVEIPNGQSLKILTSA